jgi:4-hydroxyphenylpyruvate dioxygenase-like putative hemolysin
MTDGDLWDNPMGTDGFEFVEYTGPDPAQLEQIPVILHRSRRGGNNWCIPGR